MQIDLDRSYTIILSHEALNERSDRKVCLQLGFIRSIHARQAPEG